MNQKSHILICTLCDFNIGFDITQVDQIVQKKKVKIHAKGGIVDFRGYSVPFFDLPGLFHCNDSQNKFLLLLNCSSGNFCIPIQSIEAIVDVEMWRTTLVSISQRALSILLYLIMQKE
jgi:chemotaxis signal transduction protein